MNIYFKILTGIITVLIVLGGHQIGSRAEEYRHHEAHEHGVAHMNVALEGNELFIEFISPAANIVGFEHHPRTPEQKDAVNDAVNKLRTGDRLFILSAGSEGQLVKSNVETDINKDSEQHSDSEHAHAEKGQHGQKEHHDKEHGESDEHKSHSEFKAKYHFTCKAPDKLSRIDVKLFKYFPGIEHIEVQLLTGTKQSAIDLTEKNNEISFN